MKGKIRMLNIKGLRKRLTSKKPAERLTSNKTTELEKLRNKADNAHRVIMAEVLKSAELEKLEVVLAGTRRKLDEALSAFDAEASKRDAAWLKEKEAEMALKRARHELDVETTSMHRAAIAQALAVVSNSLAYQAVELYKSK